MLADSGPVGKSVLSRAAGVDGGNVSCRTGGAAVFLWNNNNREESSSCLSPHVFPR